MSVFGAQPRGDVPLREVATELGFVYSWLGPETAVALSRPGLVIVIRPGQSWFQVNDATETSPATPRFIENDVYISPELFKRLQRIAETTRQARHTNAIEPSPYFASPGAPPSASGAPVAGGALSVSARPADGTEAIDISGKVTPARPVTLTLATMISRDLPAIIVNRRVVAVDANGDFQTTMSIAPSFFRGSLLKLVASVPGIAPATATVKVDAPNAGTGPADEVPSFVK